MSYEIIQCWNLEDDVSNFELISDVKKKSYLKQSVASSQTVFLDVLDVLDVKQYEFQL